MSFDLGDAVPLTFSVTDPAGAPAAATVTLTITQPDGTTSSPTVTNPTTGSYAAVFIPAQVGRYSVYWLGTGANHAAYNDEFNVNPSFPLILSLADMKDQLRTPPTDTSGDLRLRRLIGAVTDMVENRIGPVVKRQIVQEYVDLTNIGRFYNEQNVVGVRRWVLRNRPVISLDAIVTALTVGGFTYNVADFTVENTTGIVRRLDNGTVYGPLLVTYTVGLPYVPPAVEEAAIIVVQHLWATSQGKMGPAGRGGQDTTVMPGYGFAFPNRAEELLEPYLLTPAIG